MAAAMAATAAAAASALANDAAPTRLHGIHRQFSERVMELLDKIGHQFLVTLGFTLMGLIAFALAFVVIVKVTPFSLRKEIEEDHNVAFAIVIASIILGIAHIVASTVQG